MGDYFKKKPINDRLTNDELKFLLKRLKKIKSSSSLSKYEREIVNLIIKQTNKLINDKQNDKKEDNNKAIQNNYSIFQNRKKTLKTSLYNKINDYIIIFLKTNCKPLRGILCNVNVDYIILVNNFDVFGIKINEIASVQTNINNNNNKISKEKIKFKDQYYLEEGSKITEKKDSIKVNDSDLKQDKETHEDNIIIKNEQKKYSISEK